MLRDKAEHYRFDGNVCKNEKVGGVSDNMRSHQVSHQAWPTRTFRLQTAIGSCEHQSVNRPIFFSLIRVGPLLNEESEVAATVPSSSPFQQSTIRSEKIKCWRRSVLTRWFTSFKPWPRVWRNGHNSKNLSNGSLNRNRNNSERRPVVGP